MRFEEIVRDRLCSDEELVSMLTKYLKQPAVFFGDAPEDVAKGWAAKRQYPRVSFYYDTMANRERKSSGSLYVGVYCLSDSDYAPEDFAPIVKRLLKDVVMKPEGFSMIAMSWNSTSEFSMNREKTSGSSGQLDKEQLVNGCELQFDILEYPDQTTTDPDPVEAMNRYLKRIIPEAAVLWYDRTEDLIVASEKRPILYTRYAGARRERETNTVVWMDGELILHLFCPEHWRIRILQGICDRLAVDGEVPLLDGSPMFIRALAVRNTSDYMTEGQMQISTRYGLLRHGSKIAVIGRDSII